MAVYTSEAGQGPLSDELVGHCIKGIKRLQGNHEQLPWLSPSNPSVSVDCPLCTNPHGIVDAPFSGQCVGSLTTLATVRPLSDEAWAQHIRTQHQVLLTRMVSTARSWVDASSTSPALSALGASQQRSTCALGCACTSSAHSSKAGLLGHVLSAHTLELQHAVMLREYLARSATHSGKCPFPGCKHQAHKHLPGQAQCWVESQQARWHQSQRGEGCQTPAPVLRNISGADWKLLSKPMSVIPDPDTQDQLHTAWMAHFSNDPSHTRSLQLCAKHIVMQAKELFHGRPNSVVRCPWPMASAAATALATMACAGCGGDACGDGGSGPRCGMSATSISGLLAHHAHFHYRDAVTTDWVSMEADLGDATATPLPCPMAGCSYSTQSGTRLTHHMQHSHSRAVQDTARRLSVLAQRVKTSTVTPASILQALTAQSAKGSAAAATAPAPAAAAATKVASGETKPTAGLDKQDTGHNAGTAASAAAPVAGAEKPGTGPVAAVAAASSTGSPNAKSAETQQPVSSSPGQSSSPAKAVTADSPAAKATFSPAADAAKAATAAATAGTETPTKATSSPTNTGSPSTQSSSPVPASKQASPQGSQAAVINVSVGHSGDIGTPTKQPQQAAAAAAPAEKAGRATAAAESAQAHVRSEVLSALSDARTLASASTDGDSGTGAAFACPMLYDTHVCLRPKNPYSSNNTNQTTNSPFASSVQGVNDRLASLHSGNGGNVVGGGMVGAKEAKEGLGVTSLHQNIYDTHEEIARHIAAHHADIAAVAAAYARGVGSAYWPGRMCCFEQGCVGAVAASVAMLACSTDEERSLCLDPSLDHLLANHAPHLLSVYHTACLIASAAAATTTTNPTSTNNNPHRHNLRCPFGDCCGGAGPRGLAGEAGGAQGGRGGRLQSMVEIAFGTRDSRDMDTDSVDPCTVVHNVQRGVRTGEYSKGGSAGYGDTLTLAVHIAGAHAVELQSFLGRSLEALRAQLVRTGHL